MSAELYVVGLGRIAYAEALELQRTMAQQRIDGSLPRDVLLLVEHPPVVTLGRSTAPEHAPASAELLAARGVELFEVERGGDATFHGPGQLVGYPIYALTEHKRDLHWFLRMLEECLIRTLGRFGINAGRREGFTGVWTGGRKIASIGIHVRQWVTWHGFALNVATDLSFFDLIVPCGIHDVEMTSMRKELGERAPRDLWARTADEVVLAFSEVFGQTPRAAALEQLANS